MRDENGFEMGLCGLGLGLVGRTRQRLRREAKRNVECFDTFDDVDSCVCLVAVDLEVE